MEAEAAEEEAGAIIVEEIDIKEEDTEKEARRRAALEELEV